MFTRQDITFLHQTKQKFLKQLLGYIDKNLYDHFSCRIKTNESITNKLQQKGYEPKPWCATDYLSDIIGIRIVTQYLSDIYHIVNIIRKEYNIKEECDYIANPKESGYRSYHIIINIPVNIEKFPYTDNIDVEIQIRTMGMDFFASLEHSLVYTRQKSPDMQNNLSLVHHELHNYAEAIFSIDMRIQALQHITQEHTDT